MRYTKPSCESKIRGTMELLTSDNPQSLVFCRHVSLFWMSNLDVITCLIKIHINEIWGAEVITQIEKEVVEFAHKLKLFEICSIVTSTKVDDDFSPSTAAFDVSINCKSINYIIDTQTSPSFNFGEKINEERTICELLEDENGFSAPNFEAYLRIYQKLKRNELICNPNFEIDWIKFEEITFFIITINISDEGPHPCVRSEYDEVKMSANSFYGFRPFFSVPSFVVFVETFSPRPFCTDIVPIPEFANNIKFSRGITYVDGFGVKCDEILIQRPLEP
jgi:hypothetical protein